MLTASHTAERPQAGLDNASKPRSAAFVVLGIALVAVLAVAGFGALYRLSTHRPVPIRGADTVELRVSRDFGATTLTDRHVAVAASATVLPVLSANTGVTTAYGGGFVDSIDGVASGYTNGGSVRADWFYYVNGLQATVGAADYRLGPHDRVWWDFHAWDFAPSVPAVIGQYPEPFLSGAGAKTPPTEVLYATAFAGDADRLAESLRSAGIAQVSCAKLASAAGPPRDSHVILLGTWDDLLQSSWVREAAENPAGSGLFARSDRGRLLALDAGGRATMRVTPAGAVLATARADAPEIAIWLVTGGDISDVSAAASLVVSRPEALAGRFGVLVERSGAIVPLPIGADR